MLTKSRYANDAHGWSDCRRSLAGMRRFWSILGGCCWLTAIGCAGWRPPLAMEGRDGWWMEADMAAAEGQHGRQQPDRGRGGDGEPSQPRPDVADAGRGGSLSPKLTAADDAQPPATRSPEKPSPEADPGRLTAPELERALAELPPHLRGIMRRQWEAAMADRPASPTAEPPSRRPVAPRLPELDDDTPAQLADYRTGSRGDTPSRTSSQLALASAEERVTLDESDAMQPQLASLRVQGSAARRLAPSASSDRWQDRALPLELADEPPLDAELVRASIEPVIREVAREASGEPIPQDSSPGSTRQMILQADRLQLEANANGSDQNRVSPDTVRRWQQELSEAITKLERELEDDSTADEQEQLHRLASLRLLRLIQGDLEQACEPIEGLSRSEQTYFQHQLQALHEVIQIDGHPRRSRRWSVAMHSQRQATDQLANLAQLEIRRMAFCTEVESFGSYTPFTSYRFQPDQDVLLYCELDNVAADEVKDGFETQLQGSYEIIGPQGERIVDRMVHMPKQRTGHRLRDYFVIYPLRLPKQLPAGSYRLELTIEDMIGKKFAQSQLEFEVTD